MPVLRLSAGMSGGVIEKFWLYCPSRRESLDINNVRCAVSDAARNNILSVCFYGGEPFVNREMLYASLKEVYQQGKSFFQRIRNDKFGNGDYGIRQQFDSLVDDGFDYEAIVVALRNELVRRILLEE